MSIFETSTYELYSGRPRSTVPSLPEVTESVQLCVSDWGLGLAYLALQVRDNDNKRAVVRAIASGVAIIFEEQGNILGAPNLPGKFNGLVDFASAEPSDADSDPVCPDVGFEDSVEVKRSELVGVAAAEVEELAAVFAMYVQTAGKKPNDKNISAFDTKRLRAVKSVCKELLIFGHSSDLLSLQTLDKVASCLNAYAHYRARLVSSIASRIDRPYGGPPHAFKMLFILLTDTGLGALKTIKIATARWGWLRADFPELKPELEAAQSGVMLIRQIVPPDRSFCKSIYGDAFVPVNPQDISNVFGVCKYALRQVIPTYDTYLGGLVTESQKAYIDSKLANIEERRGLEHIAPPSELGD
jgi:hypothetical protein